MVLTVHVQNTYSDETAQSEDQLAEFTTPPSVQPTDTSDTDERSQFNRRRPPKLSRIHAAQSLDFDQLFKHPDQLSKSIRRQAYNNFYAESTDEGFVSLDIETEDPAITGNGKAEVNKTKDELRHGSTSGVSRTDSVMELTCTQILMKNLESSQGFGGFRRRIANDINFKYCSYCRCDDVLFLFLYTVFGIIYICAGSLGLYNCSSELLINLYLIIDGLLSIFIFPTTIMDWTKRIGGCLNEDEKLDRGVFFFVIISMRTVTGIIGTAILVMRVELIQSNNIMCLTVSVLLKVGVVLEWAFLLFAIIVPTCFYVGAYWFARSYLR